MAAPSQPELEHQTVGAARTPFAEWRASFLTGLAVLLPAALSVGVVIWLFGTISNLTDSLLFFLPKEWTHERNGEGPMAFHWSVVALLLVVFMIILTGRFARFYLGKQLIRLMDAVFRNVPLLNKIYGAFKQINDAFASSNNSSFKEVVLVEFGRPRLYCVGFLTGAQHGEIQDKTQARLLGVFVPSTPNPTTGFIVLAAEKDIIRLKMSVADGIRFIMSLGTVSPAYASQVEAMNAAAMTGSKDGDSSGGGDAKGKIAPGILFSNSIPESDPAKEPGQQHGSRD